MEQVVISFMLKMVYPLSAYIRLLVSEKKLLGFIR